jgi:hypothetical protein
MLKNNFNESKIQMEFEKQLKLIKNCGDDYSWKTVEKTKSKNYLIKTLEKNELEDTRTKKTSGKPYDDNKKPFKYQQNTQYEYNKEHYYTEDATNYHTPATEGEYPEGGGYYNNSYRNNTYSNDYYTGYRQNTRGRGRGGRGARGSGRGRGSFNLENAVITRIEENTTSQLDENTENLQNLQLNNNQDCLNTISQVHGHTEDSHKTRSPLKELLSQPELKAHDSHNNSPVKKPLNNETKNESPKKGNSNQNQEQSSQMHANKLNYVAPNMTENIFSKVNPVNEQPNTNNNIINLNKKIEEDNIQEELRRQ